MFTQRLTEDPPLFLWGLRSLMYLLSCFFATEARYFFPTKSTSTERGFRKPPPSAFATYVFVLPRHPSQLQLVSLVTFDLLIFALFVIHQMFLPICFTIFFHDFISARLTSRASTQLQLVSLGTFCGFLPMYVKGKRNWV